MWMPIVLAEEGIELVVNVYGNSILTFVFVVRKCVQWSNLLLRIRVMEVGRSAEDACFDVCEDVIWDIHMCTEDVGMDVSLRT